MIHFIVILVLISAIDSVPVNDERNAKILSYENHNDGNGNYEFSYETSNGLYRSETGKQIKDEKTNEEHLFVEGAFSYTDPEGEIHHVRYTADENGYHILPSLTPVVQSLPANVVATLLG